MDASCVADRPLVAVVSVAPIGPWSTTVLLAEWTLVLVCGRSRPYCFQPRATSGEGSDPAPSARGEWMCPGARSAYSGWMISTAPNPSSGQSTKKISSVRSGSTWACERNASTLRPVSSSIVSVKRLDIMFWNS